MLKAYSTVSISVSVLLRRCPGCRGLPSLVPSVSPDAADVRVADEDVSWGRTCPLRAETPALTFRVMEAGGRLPIHGKKPTLRQEH